MRGKQLTLTEVQTNGTLADVTANDSFEVLQVWTDRFNDTLASIGKMSEHGFPKETHTVSIDGNTLTFSPGYANISTVATFEITE